MKKSSIIYAICWLLFSSAYFLLSLWLQHRGFYNLEAYFIEYKIILIKNHESGFLRTFFFTKPSILYLASLLASFIKHAYSTYIINAILIGGLTNHLFLKGLKEKWKVSIFLLYVLCSPIIIYAGTSGGSVAMYLVFYFFFFTILFKYTASYSVFHLTLLSLLLGVFVLFDMNLLKFLLILIPVFFFVNFFKAKGINGSFYYRASIIFSNESQRRKFYTGFFSSIFIVAFIPLMAILIYLIINRIFAGDYFYFLDGIGDYWTSYSTLYPLKYTNDSIWKLIAENKVSFILPMFFVSGLALIKLFEFDGSVTKNAFILLGLLFCFSEIIDDRILNLNLSNLTLVTAAGLSAVFYNTGFEMRKQKSFSSAFYFIVPFLMVFLEFNYFKVTVNHNENLFFQAFMDPQEDETMIGLNNIAWKLNELGAERVLADDAIFYPVLTKLGKNSTWEGHFSPNFLAALQQPEAYADYVVVSKPSFLLYPNDVVAASIRRFEALNVPFDSDLVYEDRLFMLLKIKAKNK
ncbi:hypothetical protein ACFSKL_03810 [Belliella marina]|uniref:Glycosyltransferase RgtA/B/C/D-like domain-containing protein n=1 Tax=Belliella marina TaxID=1644146 RepID=A0ABW4VJG2_9BACT